MTNTCVVYNCTSGIDESDELVYLFHVPCDSKIKQKWVEAIPRTKKPLTDEHLVCHKHFKESDITRFYIQKNEETNSFVKVPYEYPRLNDTAVPSIFPGYETRPYVENSTQSPVTQVVYYNDPVQDTISDIAFYSALHDLNRPTYCHHFGSVGPMQTSSHTEVSNSTINPTSNDISTIPKLPNPSENVPQVSTTPVTNVAPPSGDIQNVPNGIGENSSVIGTETVSTNIASPPSVLPNETTSIVEQIAAPSIADVNIGNGIADTPAAIVDSAISRHAITSNIDVSNTTSLGNAVTDSASNWDNVIVDEPVAGIITASTPFVSSGGKVHTDVNDDCCGDDCCADDCCGDGCCADDCCGDGCCDDCGDCDCGDECTIMEFNDLHDNYVENQWASWKNICPQ